MSLEIREPRGDELDEVAYITAYSFEGDRSPEALEGNQRLLRCSGPWPPSRTGGWWRAWAFCPWPLP